MPSGFARFFFFLIYTLVLVHLLYIFCFVKHFYLSSPPPTLLPFFPASLLSLEGLEDHTQSQGEIMMIVL